MPDDGEPPKPTYQPHVHCSFCGLPREDPGIAFVFQSNIGATRPAICDRCAKDIAAYADELSGIPADVQREIRLPPPRPVKGDPG